MACIRRYHHSSGACAGTIPGTVHPSQLPTARNDQSPSATIDILVGSTIVGYLDRFASVRATDHIQRRCSSTACISFSTLSPSARALGLYAHASGLQAVGCPPWILCLPHVGFIGLTRTSPPRRLLRHSCNPYLHLPLQKLVGRQDLPGTQPPTWLLQWLTRLPCILGQPRWAYLQAFRLGGDTPLIWVILNYHLRLRTSSLPSIPSTLPNLPKLPRPSPALATCSLRPTTIRVRC